MKKYLIEINEISKNNRKKKKPLYTLFVSDKGTGLLANEVDGIKLSDRKNILMAIMDVMLVEFSMELSDLLNQHEYLDNLSKVNQPVH